MADPEGVDSFDCRVCHRLKLNETMRVCYLERDRAYVERWGVKMNLPLDQIVLMGPDEDVAESIGSFEEVALPARDGSKRAVCPMAAIATDPDVLEIVQLEAEWETYGERPLDGPRDSWPQEMVDAFRVVRQTRAREQVKRIRKDKASRKGVE